LIAAKVVCEPNGCCTPAGSIKCVSRYNSKVNAYTSTGFCFGASSFGNALGADAVQFYVDGVVVPGGSKTAMVTSGSSVIGTQTVGVGGGMEYGTEGAKASGSISIQVSSSKTTRDGTIGDSIDVEGEKTVPKVSVTCNLNAGGRTNANVDGKAQALGEQITNFAGIGMMGKETNCGAGTYWHRLSNFTTGPIGRRHNNHFKRKFEVFKRHFFL